MKPGDSVGFKEGWAGEIPPGCVPRQKIWSLGHHGDTGTLLHIDGKGRAAVALAGFGAALTGSGDTAEYLAPCFCLVVPAAVLEPVPPPLPEGWRVFHGDGWTELWHGSQGEVARVIGDRLVASLPAHLPYPDSAAAIAHLLAVAVPTIATGGELYAVASEVARG